LLYAEQNTVNQEKTSPKKLWKKKKQKSSFWTFGVAEISLAA